MSIPPEFVLARMEAKKAKEARCAPASTDTSNTTGTLSTTKQSSASIYSQDTVYSYDKDSLKKATPEKDSLGSKIKKVLK